jgi:cobalt/nickel transport system permease protein
MHIPDGFLDAKTVTMSGALAAGSVGLALRQLRQNLARPRVPLMGLAAAFIFAAQMLNFPVAGGTSGHLVGGVLAAVLLGPSAAVIVITCVLTVQCFLFADGGVLAMGANIFNMALVSGVGGYAIYRLVRRWTHDTQGVVMAASFAAWCATVLAAISCAGQLAWSGAVPWSTAFPTMAGVHMLIGIGEAIITALAVAMIARTRPDLTDQARPANMTTGYAAVIGYGLLISLGLALFVSPFASPWPDGLERVAAKLGFAHRALARPLIHSPIPDYAMPGISSAGVATAVAGVVGIIVVFGMAVVLARMLTPKSEARPT